MSPESQHVAGALLAPERAQCLETLCAALATESASGSARSGELNARFGAVTRTIRDVSRNWNLTHDYLRVLPIELRAMCWSYLPQADLVQLARVCSSWRDLSRGIPSLWTSIDVLGGLSELDTLLARSAQSPFELSVTVHSVQEHADVDSCLRKHAHRLRALHVSDKHYSFAGTTRGQDLFRYPAPMLEHFSLKLISQTNDGNFTLAPDIFLGCAPNLRSVTLDQIPFPSVCAAFSRLTTLKFRWSLGVPTSGLQQIFTVSPFLEQLELSDVSNVADLPPPSSCATLRKITLTADDLNFNVLHAQGYLDIPELIVSTSDARPIYNSAMHESPSLHVTLSISGTGAEVILRSATGAKARFTGGNAKRHAVDFAVRHSPHFPSLQRLVLPTTVLHPFGLTGGARYPYLDGDLALLELRELVLAHGAPGAVSIFESGAVLGALVAPRLARIEIVRAPDADDPNSRSGPGAAAIPPGALAVFIAAHVQCCDPAALEVFVGPEDAGLLDVGDEDGMESLRRCVGRVVC